jgi:hypothetical protein
MCNFFLRDRDSKFHYQLFVETQTTTSIHLFIPGNFISYPKPKNNALCEHLCDSLVKLCGRTISQKISKKTQRASKNSKCVCPKPSPIHFFITGKKQILAA